MRTWRRCLTSSNTVKAIKVELPLERGELGVAEPAGEEGSLRRFSSSQKQSLYCCFSLPDFYLLRQNDLSKLLAFVDQKAATMRLPGDDVRKAFLLEFI